MPRSLVPLSLMLLLAACARSEDASTLPTDTNEMQAAETVRALPQDDREVALGEWRAGLQDERPSLEFGPVGTAPLFSIVCAPGGGLFLQRHGAVAFEGLQMMTIQLGGQTRRVAVSAIGGTVPMLRASIPATGPLIQEIATEQGPITIHTADGAPLRLPHSPMIGEYIGSCPGEGRVGTPNEAGNAAAADEAGEEGNSLEANAL